MGDELRDLLRAVATGALAEDRALPLLRGLLEPGTPAPSGTPEMPAPEPSARNGAEPRAFGERAESRYPLSRGQAALWAIQQDAPASTAYNLPLALRMRPDADPVVLWRALAAVVRRHPALRIKVVAGEGGPEQVVTDRPCTLAERDFTHLTEGEARERVRRLIHTPFDVEHDPLHRAYFVRGPWPGPVLLLVFHHLVTDGVSSHLLLRELVAEYESRATGGEPVRPEPSVPYSVFVRRQRELLAGPEAAEDKAYWTGRLRGASSGTVLDRLADRHRAQPSRPPGASVQSGLARAEWEAVREAARRLRLTPFTVAHAAFVWLLHRYSGADDICVTVPTDGRHEQRFDRTVGYLINPVVLRTACTPRMTVRELCTAVHEELLDAEDHSRYPFAEVVGDLRREGGGPAEFDIGFYLQQGVGRDLDMAAGQTLIEDALDFTQEGESDLVLEVVVRDGGGALVFAKYDPARFERSTVERFAEHYRALLARMAEDTEGVLGAVELADPRERQLLREVNSTEADNPCHPTAAELVLAQAGRTPEATALVDAEQSLSYRQLADRVRLLAAVLRERGVREGALIGVLAERRAELVVTLLAVGCAGGAYVPLDAQFPAERLEFIASDAGLTALVADTASAPALPSAPVEVLLLDEVDWNDSAAPRLDPVDPVPGGFNDRTAYVLYTSGSTGVPKGVRISHGNLANFLASMRERPGCAAGDRLLAVTTVGFDIAGLELLLPLTCGAAVEIAPSEVVQDGFALRERLESSAPTLVQATPATWQMLLAAGWTGRLPGKILCGGEALPPALAEKLLNRADEVWNMYGPTETTIWSSVARVLPHRSTGVGTPVANTRVHVLDEERRPVPFGVTGEVHLAGHGVALGYHGRPELTAEKFPDGAFLGEPGRLFRTGDAGRHLPDGSLEILGRLDRQVKLRGHRIEPGEIEAALSRSDLVEEARVLLREDTPGHSALVGFVRVPATADAGAAARILDDSAAWLPGYMVPARLVFLRAFPQTPNAKIDTGPLERLGLDEIVRTYGHPAGAERPAADDDAQPPAHLPSSGPLAEELLGWVAELARLPVEKVSPRRPLGDFGFDSIRFTRLSAVLRDRLDLAVAPTVFYGHPTVEALAEHLLDRFPEQLAARYGASTEPAAPATAGRATVRESVAPVRPAEVGAADGYPPVAITGVGARLPRSETLEEFWSHLAARRDLVTPYPQERGFARALFDRHGGGDPRAFQGAFVPDVAGFEAPLFRVSPREAAQMDPQQRLLLHAAHEAMQDTGLAPEEFSGTATGVFVGLTGADYFSLLGHEAASDDHFLLGNVASVAANRISHLFNLTGQSAIYDTACSSSLVALHRAARALQLGECDTALAGGANLLLSPYGFLGLRRAGMLSPDGRCKTFDARADGYGRGEGVVLLMLKLLDRARADGDPVHGVLIGSAENHGGRTHSLTVPNPRAQSDVLVSAHEAAAVPPASVGYVEAHGTGTELGDPIEVEGLKDGFARLADRWGPAPEPAGVALGSVKTNIGHLEASAGVAGVVKVLLAMRHRTLPGLVHLGEPNPMLELDGSPFRLQRETAAWEPARGADGEPQPRRAGVSSFGMGGSNAHVVLEEAEER